MNTTELAVTKLGETTLVVTVAATTLALQSPGDTVLHIEGHRTDINVAPAGTSVSTSAVDKIEISLAGLGAGETVLSVAASGPQGPRGNDGPPGAPGVLLFSATANEAIIAGQAVVIRSDGRLERASAAEIGHAGKTVGLAVSSGALDAEINYLNYGDHAGGWIFMPGQPVYLGIDGALTQSNAAGLFQQEVGIALTPSRILFSPGLCIVR